MEKYLQIQLDTITVMLYCWGMDTYTITEIENMTGIPRRTIHFYIKEQMIPPPLGRGGAARYGEDHLMRLQVIRALHNSNLQLKGIREYLGKMDVPAMRRFLSGAEAGRKEWDEAAIAKLTGSEPAKARNISFAKLGADEGEQFGNLLSALPSRATTRCDTWQRITIAEGVEINLSTNLPESTRQSVLDLAGKLRARLEGKEKLP
jgi:DNA-binding transcriptional MerR regulator